MKRRKSGSRSRGGADVRKGIYILPNFVTSLNILGGFWCIIAASRGDFYHAAILIPICHLLDGIDGRVARLTGTTSKFGVEYDSLSDVTSFGVAPAFLAYSWALADYGRWGWLLAWLFLTAGAVRLARFNVMADTMEKGRFLGLPIPAAADVIAAVVLISERLGKAPDDIKPILMLLLITSLAFLMVSNVRFRSFKDFQLTKRQPVWFLFALLGLIVCLVAEFEITGFCLALTYMLSGPVEWVLGRRGGAGAAGPLGGVGLAPLEDADEDTDEGGDDDGAGEGEDGDGEAAPEEAVS